MIGKAIQHDIHITPSGNLGFVMQIGCAVFTYADSESLIQALQTYLQHPKEMERAYSEKVGGAPQPQVEASGLGSPAGMTRVRY